MMPYSTRCLPGLPAQSFSGRELYQPLYTLHTDALLLERLRQASQAIEIEWITLGEGSPLVGKSAGKASIRQRTGASIVTVLRGDQIISNPGADLTFEAQDVLAVLGTPSQREAFRAFLGGEARSHTSQASLVPRLEAD